MKSFAQKQTSKQFSWFLLFVCLFGAVFFKKEKVS